MLQIHSHGGRRYCDGMTRRDFLRAGVLGLGGLGLADIGRLRAQDGVAGQSPRDTAVILIWLDGGPTHIDSYDMKPEAPVEFRGPLMPTRTNVPGIDICDLMPRQARIMDKLALIRSLQHSDAGHGGGAYWMLSGHAPAPRGSAEEMYPSAGSIAARFRGANRRGMPAYVGVPFAATDTNVPGFHGASYLGLSYNPFQLYSDPNTANYGVRNMTLPGGITLEQLDDRRRLLSSLDTLRRDIDRSGMLASLDQFQLDAFDLITGPAAGAAFDIGKETPRLRDHYGRHTWGQSCLLARRLVEHGVTFVTVQMSGWDQHGGVFDACRGELPILDRAVSALVEDLTIRGLYERVAICMFGEFGRTPRINAQAGRDHWSQASFCLMGGGGLRTGLVVGATTDKAERPTERPIAPADLLATLYHVLGIDPTATILDRTGRPRPVLATGAPVAALI